MSKAALFTILTTVIKCYNCKNNSNWSN